LGVGTWRLHGKDRQTQSPRLTNNLSPPQAPGASELNFQSADAEFEYLAMGSGVPRGRSSPPRPLAANTFYLEQMQLLFACAAATRATGLCSSQGPRPQAAPPHHQLQAFARMPRNPQQLLVSRVLVATMPPPVRLLAGAWCGQFHRVSEGMVRTWWPEMLAQRAGLQLQYRMRGFQTWSGCPGLG
jgi:hypothetical protein